MSFIGQIKTSEDLEQAILQHLKDWELYYLAQAEADTGREPQSVRKVRSWSVSPDEAEKWPEDALPAVILGSPGTLGGDPMIEGDGEVSMRWRIAIGVIDKGRTQEGAHRLARMRLERVIRPIMLQATQQERFWAGVEWRGDDYDIWPRKDRRMVSGGAAEFMVEVRDVLDRDAGVLTPPENPYDLSDPTTFTEVEIDAERRLPDEEIDDESS